MGPFITRCSSHIVTSLVIHCPQTMKRSIHMLHHFVLLSMPIAYGVTLNSQTSFHGCCRFRTSAEHLPKLVNSHPPGFAEIISPSLRWRKNSTRSMNHTARTPKRVQEVHQVTMHWRVGEIAGTQGPNKVTIFIHIP